MSGTCETEEWPPNGTSVLLTYGCCAKAALGYETNGGYQSRPANRKPLQCLLAARLQEDTKRHFHCGCDKLEQELMLACLCCENAMTGKETFGFVGFCNLLADRRDWS